MTTLSEALIAMREYLRRARQAGAAIAQDPSGQEILQLVMQAEARVDGWLRNPDALIEPLDSAAGEGSEADDTEIASVLDGLRSITAGAKSDWATADHIAERIGRPLGDVLDALNAAAARGWIESVYQYTLSYRGEQWLIDEGDFLLGDD